MNSTSLLVKVIIFVTGLICAFEAIIVVFQYAFLTKINDKSAILIILLLILLLLFLYNFGHYVLVGRYISLFWRYYIMGFVILVALFYITIVGENFIAQFRNLKFIDFISNNIDTILYLLSPMLFCLAVVRQNKK